MILLVLMALTLWYGICKPCMAYGALKRDPEPVAEPRQKLLRACDRWKVRWLVLQVLLMSDELKLDEMDCLLCMLAGHEEVRP